MRIAEAPPNVVGKPVPLLGNRWSADVLHDGLIVAACSHRHKSRDAASRCAIDLRGRYLQRLATQAQRRQS